MQFHACGCPPHYRHRTKRSVWMRLFPKRRLFECVECGARMLLLVKNSWAPYTGTKPKLGPAWHPDPRTLTRARQPRPATVEAVLPLLAADMAARAVAAQQRAQAPQPAPQDDLGGILLPAGKYPFLLASSLQLEMPSAAATTTACLKDGKCTGQCGGNLAAGYGACLAPKARARTWNAANEQGWALAR
jgi:hypothetical protein